MSNQEGGFLNLEKFALEGVRGASFRSAASNPRGPFTFDISYTVPGEGECNFEVVARSFSEAKLLAFGIVPLGVEYRVCRVSGNGLSYDVIVCYEGARSCLEMTNATLLPRVPIGGGRDEW